MQRSKLVFALSLATVVAAVIGAIIIARSWSGPGPEAATSSNSTSREDRMPANADSTRPSHARSAPEHERDTDGDVVQSPHLAALEAKLGRSIGTLSANDREKARLYLDPLRDTSFSELETFRRSHEGIYDAATAAEEADLLRSAFLWEAVIAALEKGDYWLGYDYPSRLPRGTQDVYFQVFSVAHDGKPATAVFFIGRSTAAGSEFIGASDYYRTQRQFWLQDAAYRFNSLPDSERASLLARYEREMKSGGRARLPADLANVFPSGVHVEEGSLIMRAGR